MYPSHVSLCLSGDLTSDHGACFVQIRELLDYLARGLSDDDRQKLFGQILEPFKPRPPLEGETTQGPSAISPENQVKILSLLVPEVKGLGEGSEKGACYLAPPERSIELTEKFPPRG